MKDLIDEGVSGENGLSRASRRTPASAGTRSPPAPGRASTARRTTPSTAPARATSTTAPRFATTGILQADTIAAGRRARRQDGRLGRVGRRAEPRAGAPGPGRRLPHLLLATAASCSTTTCRASRRGANAFGVAYQRVDLDRATGWTNVPASFSPAEQEQLTVTTRPSAPQTTSTALRPLHLRLDERRDATTTACSSCRRRPEERQRRGRRPRAGEWADVEGHADRRARRADRRLLPEGDRHRPDLSKFRLYFTSIARVNATYNALGAAGLGGVRGDAGRDFPTSTAADFAPLEARIVDEDTYVEQGLKWKDAHFAYLRYIFDDARRTDPTCCCSATRSRTSSSTSSWRSSRRPTWTATRTRTSTTSTNDDVRTAASPIREGYIRAAYHEADETLGARAAS